MQERKIKVLYAEDDKDTANLCREYLTQRNFEVTMAYDGDQAWELYCSTVQDIILLDVMMPGKSGYELTMLIRKQNANIPILILTSLCNSTDAVTAFSLGATDFIRKEYLLTEIEARIHAVLRRKEAWDGHTTFFKLSTRTSFNCITRKLTIDGKDHLLTTNETKLLRLLSLKINTCAEKEYLCMGVWGIYDPNKSRYLDRDILALRRLLSADGQLQIVNHFGVGFCLTNE